MEARVPEENEIAWHCGRFDIIGYCKSSARKCRMSEYALRAAAQRQKRNIVVFRGDDIGQSNLRRKT